MARSSALRSCRTLALRGRGGGGRRKEQVRRASRLQGQFSAAFRHAAEFDGRQCSQLTISQSLESIIEETRRPVKAKSSLSSWSESACKEPEPSGAVFPDTLEGWA